MEPVRGAVGAIVRSPAITGVHYDRKGGVHIFYGHIFCEALVIIKMTGQTGLRIDEAIIGIGQRGYVRVIQFKTITLAAVPEMIYEMLPGIDSILHLNFGPALPGPIAVIEFIDIILNRRYPDCEITIII